MRILSATSRPGKSGAWRDPDSCYRNLAIAVILQALKEAVRGDDQARYWVINQGLSWLDLAGFNINASQVENFIATKQIEKKNGGRARLF